MRSQRAVVFVAMVLASAGRAYAGADPYQATFEAAGRAEALAHVTVRCQACAWDVAGREAAVLALTLDGRYSQHLPVVRGGRAEYSVFLGRVEAGTHTLSIAPDGDLSARELRAPDAATVEAVRFEIVAEREPAHTALSLAPFVHARPNTVGRFTDVPLFMWYEAEPTARGTRYRYSVIFSNEDGGTPTDRLMATWGRTTDIEYLYSVEVDGRGEILDEDMQGPEHETLPYRGTREGRHPLLWVVTRNNMVLDTGNTQVRYAPAPVAFPLADVSREQVMDAHPWLYRVMAQELAREGKIVAGAPPGRDTIPDPRRFVYVEACGEAGVTALAFSVRAGDAWHASDRGVREYRIVRAGCFRGAVPLPDGILPASVTALRFDAYERPNPPGAGQPVSDRPAARLTRVNAVFMLDDEHRPTPSRFRWQGDVNLAPGESKEFALP